MEHKKVKGRTLTREEKLSLYRDGYVVVKKAVSDELVDAARYRINNAEKGTYPGAHEDLTNLVNASDVTPVLHEAMGYFDPPIACQVGVLRPRKPGEYFNNVGYKDKGMPYFGAESHMDGLCTIGVPQEVVEGTPEEIYYRYISSGPKGDIGRSADVMGHNSVPLFEDPAMTLGMGSFTTFAFVCLNDQTREGCGQTALLRGAHHETEKFFRWQYEVNGHIGPEGPGWPRLDYDCENHCGLVYLPQMVRDKFIDDTSDSSPDGMKWPRPTQILMEPGDACLTLFNMPHSATRNEFGTENRTNIIFRIRNKKRQPNHMVSGVSDHPDRGQRGEWLEYEEGNDPWLRSKFALCNMWDEWEGMQDIVTEMEGQERVPYEV
ncbi:MAG: hypothetical protein OXC80_06365 [Gammaproteobacteria bacterium]|nr:hypothetical protein [Gammaproteobacteria bacterium]